MPSPLAHCAVALAAGVAAPSGSPLRAGRAVLAAAIAGVVSDVDLLLSATLPGGIAWHHGPSHSLIGATLLGLLVGLAFGQRGASLAWCGIAGFSHPILDWELGDPATASTFGVPLAWPFSSQKFVSPVPIFLAFGIHREGFLLNMVAPDALAAYLREAVFSACVLGYVRFTRGRFRVLPRFRGDR